MLSFSHIGDLGDALVSLASVKSLGGGIYYAMDKPGCRAFIARMPLLERLFRDQNYISDFLPYEGQKIDHDFSTFRDAGHPYGVSLAKLHSNWVGATPDLAEPWLRVTPSKQTKNKIVVSRTGRYQNPYFPWHKLTEALRPHIIFVGLTEEYTNFCSEFGYVDRFAVNDLYEVATAIAGSDMLIANQSCPMAICEGLKHRCIQETCLWVPDCIYPRKNAIHCIDGYLSFGACGIHFENPPHEEKPVANIAETPPGGWVLDYKGVSFKSYAFKTVKTVAQANFPGEDLTNLIMEQSSKYVPLSNAMNDLKRAKELLAAL